MDTQALEKIKEEISRIVVQSSFPEEPFHSINTLEWLLKLNPDADDALQIAALGHDIERAYNDKRIQSADYETYDEYKQAHALNSAQILTGIMEKCGVDQNLVDDVAHLVAHHEMGGDDREELLKNADTISFFHVCLPLFFDRKGPDTTRKRCVWGFKKLPEELREIVAGLDFMDEELKDLVRDALGLE